MGVCCCFFSWLACAAQPARACRGGAPHLCWLQQVAQQTPGWQPGPQRLWAAEMPFCHTCCVHEHATPAVCTTVPQRMAWLQYLLCARLCRNAWHG